MSTQKSSHSMALSCSRLAKKFDDAIVLNNVSFTLDRGEKVGSVGSNESDARKTLNRFRLTARDMEKRLADLSPGEYSRLIIAELFLQRPNCIILDEPSNHIDFEVLEELEEALAQYRGTLIVVSHDRQFVKNIGLDKVIHIDK